MCLSKGMVSNISINQENKHSDFDAVGRIHSQLLSNPNYSISFRISIDLIKYKTRNVQSLCSPNRFKCFNSDYTISPDDLQ